VLLVMGLVMLYPMIWLVGASFKTNAEVFTEIGFWPSYGLTFGLCQGMEDQHGIHVCNVFPELIPDHHSQGNRDGDFVRAWWPMRSARFEFWGKKFLFSVMVGTMMLPLIMLRLPQYLMFKEFGWVDTYLPLIVPSAFATDTFFRTSCWSSSCAGFLGTWKRPHRSTVATRLQLLWHILIPILKPAHHIGRGVSVHLEHE